MAKRKYPLSLLSVLECGQFETEKDGIKITVKPIPEGGASGEMDPRLYKKMRLLPILMKFIKIDGGDKSPEERVKPFRKIMDGVKSRPIADEGIGIERFEVQSTGGYRVPVRVYKKSEKKDLPIFIYFHGGGFFGGSPDVVEQMCKVLVQNLDCVAFNVGYRLCPEAHYPMPFDDCWAATKYIYENAEKFGGNKAKICVSGDSAGGNLAAAVAMKDKMEKFGMVALQVLLYPASNLSMKKPKFYCEPDNSKYDVGEKHKKVLNLSIAMMGGLMGSDEMLANLYLQGHAASDDPYVSPAMGDLTGLPPTMLIFGEHDMLVFDNFGLAKGLTEVKVPLKTVVYRGLGHGFADQIGVLPQAEDCMREIAAFMKKNFARR